MRATRTSEIGVSKGTSETAIAADAARPASESAITSESEEISEIIMAVSAWKSAGKSGRKARSTKRPISTSSSEGRDSRFRNPPGNVRRRRIFHGNQPKVA
jgi:hypothetical protein